MAFCLSEHYSQYVLADRSGAKSHDEFCHKAEEHISDVIDRHTNSLWQVYGYSYTNYIRQCRSFTINSSDGQIIPTNTNTNIYVNNPLNLYTNVVLEGEVASEPQYDLDGNMTDKGKSWHFQWNDENRMILAPKSQHVVTYQAPGAQGRYGKKVAKTKRANRGDVEC